MKKVRVVVVFTACLLAVTGCLSAVVASQPHRPRLDWTERLGGRGSSVATSIAVGSAGDVYVAGFTFAPEFPGRVIAGGFRHPGEPFGIADAVVMRFSALGDLVWSATIGGHGHTEAAGIAVDIAGRVYVTGSTSAADYPTTADALQRSSSDDDANERLRDVFLSVLEPDGSGLVYSTYLGGSSYDEGRALMLDREGRVHVAGVTSSSDFPTQDAIQPELGDDAWGDIFVTVIEGSRIAYSTYLGGDGLDYPYGIAVDSAGATYVAGYTESVTFPTTSGAFQSAFPGTSDQGFPTRGDGFVTKIAPDGATLAYSTYYGSIYRQSINGLAVDASGSAYITGWGESARLPTTPKAFQTTRPSGGAWHGFAAKLTPEGSALVYASWIGGLDPTYNFETSGQAVAVDDQGTLYVVGETSAAKFPVRKPFQRHNATEPFNSNIGGDDAFILALDAKGRRLKWSSYLGGEHDEGVRCVALDSSGGLVLAGSTTSSSLGVCENCEVTDPPTYQHLFLSRITSRARPKF